MFSVRVDEEMGPHTSSTEFSSGNFLGNPHDPYCELKIGSEQRRTEYIPQTNQPAWNEMFTFFLSSDAQSSEWRLKTLDLTVWDKVRWQAPVRIFAAVFLVHWASLASVSPWWPLSLC
jgi:hypothetical protein